MSNSQLQKRAIRIITLSNFNSHTDPPFKKINLLKVNDMPALQFFLFYYKFIHNTLPTYLQQWQVATNSKIHGHNTRNQNKIHIYGTKHTFAKQCLKYSLTNTINDTSQSVKNKLYTHSYRVNYANIIFRIIKHMHNHQLIYLYIHAQSTSMMLATLKHYKYMFTFKETLGTKTRQHKEWISDVT